MDLGQLADIGEFVGGAGVLVTLIYLARQTREMNRMVTGVSALWESEYFENRHGTLSDPVWARRLDRIARVLSRPSYEEVWSQVKDDLTDEFRDEVARAMARVAN